MSLDCGIVGLPNVGKSTLFNCLTKTMAAEAANYPFCTVDPNIGIVNVVDEKLDKVAAISKSLKTVYSQVRIVDIAGLVKGASRGEGLGNKFLANIRETDAIIHVVRCFDNDDVTHVEGTVDPVRDIQIIETELLLSDIERMQELLNKKHARESQDRNKLIEFLLPKMNDGICVNQVEIPEGMVEYLPELHLITAKPVMYLCNVDDQALMKGGNKYVDAVKVYKPNANILMICAEIESELSALPKEEEKEYLESYGLKESGINRLAKAAYKLLNLISYFTAGPKESRAWTIHNGDKAPTAAGKIHTDMQKGFICAEVISYEDFINSNGEQHAKEKGLMRKEGKDYIVKENDIMLFRFNI